MCEYMNHSKLTNDEHQEEWSRLSRVETIGELMLKMHSIKLSQLTELVNEWKENPDMPLGQLAVERGLISQESLFEYLKTQSKINKVVDESLHDLGHMTNKEKWDMLLEHDSSLGDILIKKKALKLTQLSQVVEEQKLNPEKSLEELLLEKSLVTQKDIDEAVAFYQNLEEKTTATVQQIHNFSS